MDVLLALKDAIESDARIDAKKKRKWVDFLVTVRKDFYNRWVKEDVHKALFVSFEQEAQELLDKYLDEVEATLDNRTMKDPITSEERKPDERFLRQVEEKIRVSDSGKRSFRQEVVRKAMGAYKRGEKFTLDSHAPLHDAVEQYLFEQRRDVLRLVSSTHAPGRRGAAEDLGGREAAGRRVRLRRVQRARSAELRHYVACPRINSKQQNEFLREPRSARRRSCSLR